MFFFTWRCWSIMWWWDGSVKCCFSTCTATCLGGIERSWKFFSSCISFLLRPVRFLCAVRSCVLCDPMCCTSLYAVASLCAVYPCILCFCCLCILWYAHHSSFCASILPCFWFFSYFACICPNILCIFSCLLVFCSVLHILTTYHNFFLNLLDLLFFFLFFSLLCVSTFIVSSRLESALHILQGAKGGIQINYYY